MAHASMPGEGLMPFAYSTAVYSGAPIAQGLVLYSMYGVRVPGNSDPLYDDAML